MEPYKSTRSIYLELVTTTGFLCTTLLIIWITTFGLNTWIEALNKYYAVAITMIFGSFVAGSTPLGGGAVAFPIMTKLFNISAHDSQLFSLAIQSAGMTSASILILIRNINQPYKIMLAYLFGVLIGFMFFHYGLSSVIIESEIRTISSICIALFVIVFTIQHWRPPDQFNNICLSSPLIYILIIAFGIMGGMISRGVGYGADLMIFTLLRLVLGFEFKQSIQASVIVMAITSLLGIVFQKYTHGIPDQVLQFWYAAAPIVIFGAPIGALFCSLINDNILFFFIIVLSIVEVITTIITVPVSTNIIYYISMMLIIALMTRYCIKIVSYNVKFRVTKLDIK